MSNIMPYLLIVVLIMLSAFFSASEISFAAANQLRLKKRAESGKRLNEKLAYYISRNYDDALTPILIGNNLVNIGASSVATVIVLDIFGGNQNYAWIATLVMTIIILTFGEIIPKIFAKAQADTFVLAVSLPVRGLMLILKPISYVVMLIIKLISKLWESKVTDNSAVTEDDLENIIDIIGEEGVIDEEQCDLLHSALDFGDVEAYEIVTPRVDMFALDINDEQDEIIKTIESSQYSRIPVYENTVDNVIGILHVNTYYRSLVDSKEVNIKDLLMPVHFVYKTMALSDVLAEMKRTNSHMVIVSDEYGGTQGLLTMEDVLEQLVGDIWDESDIIEPEFEQVDENTFLADGDMRIEDFFDELDMDERDLEDDGTTLGGWVIDQIDKLPQEGDHFEYKNLQIRIVKTDHRRVIKVEVKVTSDAEKREEE